MKKQAFSAESEENNDGVDSGLLSLSRVYYLADHCVCYTDKVKQLDALCGHTGHIIKLKSKFIPMLLDMFTLHPCQAHTLYLCRKQSRAIQTKNRQ